VDTWYVRHTQGFLASFRPFAIPHTSVIRRIVQKSVSALLRNCNIDKEKLRRSKSKLLYDWQSVNMSWYRVPLWDLRPDMSGNVLLYSQPTWEKINEDLSLDKPLQVIYTVSKLAYRIWVILIASKTVKKILLCNQQCIYVTVNTFVCIVFALYCCQFSYCLIINRRGHLLTKRKGTCQCNNNNRLPVASATSVIETFIILLCYSWKENSQRYIKHDVPFESTGLRSFYFIRTFVPFCIFMLTT
jgi:hypothetical protein